MPAGLLPAGSKPAPQAPKGDLLLFPEAGPDPQDTRPDKPAVALAAPVAPQAPRSDEGRSIAFRWHVVDTPEAFRAFVADLARQKAFAFDTETTGLDLHRAELVGLSFAWSDDEGWYVPLRGPSRRDASTWRRSGRP